MTKTHTGPSYRLFRRALTMVLLSLAGGSCRDTQVAPPNPPEEVKRALTVLPPGFADETVFSGLALPTAVRFASDGRVFVALKGGEIFVYPNMGSTTRTLVADLRTQVQSFWDRGLLGFELDPNFPASPNLYVLYAFDADIGGTPPKWGDTCPTPPGATDDGCTVSGRLSKLTLSGNTMTSEQVLLEAWGQQYPSHSIGSLVFGQDGALYLSAGDGASFNFVDYGQDGSPINPIGDTPGGVGAVLTPPTAEGGALRSQSLRRVAGPALLNGAVLRLDPATGGPMAGNPQIGSADPNARRIVAYGLRNPFRMTRRPGTNELYAGDVGWGTWEEIDRVFDPADGVVENFGWPCYEGDARQGGYEGAGLGICTALYAAGVVAHTAPLFAYRHGAATMAGDTCPLNGSSSITGLAFYTGGKFPAQYEGALFFSDYSRRCIWAMLPGPGGVPDKTKVVNFWRAAAADDPSPVELTTGADGALYYVDHIGGRIQRLRYLSPTAVISGTPLSGPGPLAVTLSSAGSGPGVTGEAVSYAWDLDGDGQFDDSNLPNPSSVYGVEGSYSVRLQVTDLRGVAVVSQPVVITVTSTPLPTAVATGAPLAGPAPLTVNFTSMGSTAAGPTETLLFAWDLDGDGEFDDSTDAAPFFSYATQGLVTVRLRVTDPRNASTVSNALTVDVGAPPGGGGTNTPPVPVIDTPLMGASWAVLDSVYFAGHATDDQDGSLLPIRLTWQIIVQHCPDACHAHVIEERNGVSSGTFVYPDHEYPMHLDLKLTATDSNGVSASVVRRLDAKTVTLNLQSNPPGLSLTLAAATAPAPLSLVVIQGATQSVAAPSPQTVNGITYDFASWSDGGAVGHNVVAGATTTLTATFSPRPVIGVGTGLKATYFDNQDFSAQVLTRTDATVDFDWGNGSPDPSVGADTFTARWEGQVQAKTTETVMFFTNSDDGIRLWVNGQLVIDNWTDHAPVDNSGAIALVAGQKYDLKLEFYENGGGAVAKLSWSSPTMARETVPQTQLYPLGAASVSNGGACVAAAECLSGFCVNGVCCNSGCTGPCVACNRAGSSGTCGSVPAGTQCATASCTAGTQSAARSCDGAGTCQAGATASCTPYVCGASACLVACAVNADCASGSSCVAGVCQTLAANGSACVQSNLCASGSCVDGVCCNSACTGGCFACNLAGAVGTCTALASGVDPKDACAVEAVGTCGLDGSCNGAGGCRLHQVGATCASPSCASGVQIAARTCDGAGTCQAGATASCTPYVCGASACLVACAVNADCASGSSCVAGVCQTLAANGSACVQSNLCASGSCVDGVCCNSACTGGCFACNLAGAVGTCTALASGVDPKDACAVEAVGTCGLDGSCNGAGGCRLHQVGTACASPSCASGVQIAARTCDGAGICQAALSQACAPYVCGSAACLSACVSNSECSSGNTCQAGLCKKPGGTGLRADYFDNKDFSALSVTRTDAVVDFTWGTSAPTTAMGIDTFSVRWTGSLEPKASETVTFYSYSDDGVRLWVNGVQVINNWTDHGPTENSGSIALTAGVKVLITMEFYENTGGATARLSWSSPTIAKQIIPQSQLYPDRPGVGRGTGVQGEYFDNRDFSGTKIVRTDAEVNFNWGNGAPASSMGVDTFSVRWTGKILPPVAGTYTFYTNSDDGVRLWVNGVQIVNNWTDHAPTENSSSAVVLNAGQLYDLKMEFYEAGGGATAKLSWSGAGLPKAVVPQAQLYGPTATTP